MVSKPKELSLPDEPFYPIDRLLLFDRHNRLTWEQAFDAQAPPWDKQRRIKRWADTTALEGVDDPDTHIVQYDYFDPVTRSFQKLAITAREAAAPNLPGKYAYPKYVVAPTPAVVVGPDGKTQPLSPAILCSRAEAQALAAELGASNVVEQSSFVTGPFGIDWRGETRRQWLIGIGSDYHSAAALLQAKYKDGIGAPGEWVTTPGGPRWVSHAQDTGEQDPRPEIPIPCRRLFPQEALSLGHPMSVVVYRTDRSSEYNRLAEGGGLTAEQAETLARIDQNVWRLLARGG
ncbi:MAG: hypothetical protein KIT09_30495 [Bryobacteraceae bacterium]|nr:hypothetical protein [Bryobacteraceae bacterium]